MVCAGDCDSTQHGRKGQGNRGECVKRLTPPQGGHDPAPFLLKSYLGPSVGSVAKVCLLACGLLPILLNSSEPEGTLMDV